ncbi:MAG TPA: hypothetical protein VFQ92_08300 [Blastocatellia bacterium]|nr:hypothetical protein [Blastocatellia bacterium]
MPGGVLKRKATPVTGGITRRSTPTVQDLASSSPDRLREMVFNALKALSPDERGRLRDKLLSDLRRAGVNLMSGLVELGIPARASDELSPNDVAKIVRYVRINSPEAVTVVGASLSELMDAGKQAVESEGSLKKVA